MLRLQTVCFIRGLTTRTTPVRKFLHTKTKAQDKKRQQTKIPTSIYSVQKLINSNSLEEDSIENLFNSMELNLFMQNVTIALVNNKGKNIDKLLNFTIDKLNEISKSEIHYKSNIPITYKEIGFNDNKSFNLLYLIFELSLHKNLPIIAFTILSNIINKCIYEINDKERIDKLINIFLNQDNLLILIDLFCVNQLEKRNLKDIDNIITLISRYNLLAEKYNYKIYEFTDIQIKSIFDKASCTIVQHSKITEISSTSTLELLIREFGSIISKRVSYSISYYKKETIETETKETKETTKKENEEEEGENSYFTVEELLDRQILSKYLQFCYLLINDRCQNNDPISIFNIWTIIKPFHNKLYNAEINSETNNLSNNFYYYQTLSKMITIFSKNRRYRKLIDEIIFDLPLDSVKICPELMSSILYHCGRTRNESLGSIVGSRYDDDTINLNSLFGENGNLNILGTGEKFTSGQVHAFLSYNLKLGNKKRAMEIVEYLRNKLIGFSAIDFNEFIRSILYSDHMKLKDIEKDSNENIVWNMIISNKNEGDKSLNKFAFTTFIDYLINNMKRKNIDLNKINLIYNIINQEFSRDDIKYWNHFYMSYFKYLIRKFPLKIAKKVYENNTREISKAPGFEKIGNYGYNTNPFNEKYMDVRISMNNNLRILVIRDIYQRSDGYFKRAKELNSRDLDEAESQYIEISQWAYNELMSMGGKNKSSKNIVHNSIIVDLAKLIDRKSRQLGFQLENNVDLNDKAKSKIKIKIKDKNRILSKSERNYRIDSGEKLAIDDVTVDEDFSQTLKAANSRCRHVFR